MRTAQFLIQNSQGNEDLRPEDREAGFLGLEGDEYSVLRLTRNAGGVLFYGQRVVFREKAVREEQKPAVRRETQLPEECASLLDALKALRLQLAKEEDVPAYIVFSNAVLTEIAARRPRNMSEFLEIPGVGYVKAARYGSLFLDAVAGWEARQ